MAPHRPNPLSNADPAILRTVVGVALDIDETLSTRGKLTPEAYRALWKLKAEGLLVVPITGRPSGWCDHFARFWPVDAVVGENGAFSFFMHDGKRRRIDTPGALGETDRRSKLKHLEAVLRKRFPFLTLASDQAYREHDLAIDFCEDVPAWPEADVRELVKICEAEGAHAKVSSIHVNTWYGEFNKMKGFEALLAQAPMALPPVGSWLFVGDSPNDEPRFEAFSKSVGVANLSRFLGDLKHPPTWITQEESGAGFVELVDALVRARHERSSSED